MTRNEAPAITNYTLNKGDKPQQPASIGTALKRLAPFLADEKRIVVECLCPRRFIVSVVQPDQGVAEERRQQAASLLQLPRRVGGLGDCFR